MPHSYDERTTEYFDGCRRRIPRRSVPWRGGPLHGCGERWAIDIKVGKMLTDVQTLLVLRAQLDQHQTTSKDIPMEAPLFCEVLGTGNKEAAKTRQERYVLW
jgi:hypothetical protein